MVNIWIRDADIAAWKKELAETTEHLAVLEQAHAAAVFLRDNQDKIAAALTYRGSQLEDAADVEVARQRLAEIKEHPSCLVRGAALDNRLALLDEAIAKATSGAPVDVIIEKTLMDLDQGEPEVIRGRVIDIEETAHEDQTGT